VSQQARYSDGLSTAGPPSSGSNVFGSPTLRPRPVSDRSDSSTSLWPARTAAPDPAALSLSAPSTTPPRPSGRSLSSGSLIHSGYDTRFTNETALRHGRACELRILRCSAVTAFNRCTCSACRRHGVCLGDRSRVRNDHGAAAPSPPSVSLRPSKRTEHEVGEGSSTAALLLISVDVDRQEADLRPKSHGEVNVLRNLIPGDLEGHPLSLLALYATEPVRT
jgi:hypothetical protein